jgi:cell division protein FtsI/penicillin-binding protein 2
MHRTRWRAWAAGAAVCLASCLTLWHTACAQADAKPSGNSVLDLQPVLVRAMAGRNGSAVVLDVASGKVVATYQPETAARRLALPGSSIKPFTLLALLQSGKVDTQTTLLCKRPLTIGGHRLDCTHPEMKQPFDPATALAYSCNSYFTSVAVRMTSAELRNSFLKFGFGEAGRLAPNEAAGSVELAGTQAQLQLEVIGEWGVRVTPLELLRGYQSLALLSQKPEEKLAPLFAGLEGSTSYGMARLAQPDSPMKVAGKTGTSLADEGRWRHGWFGGYAPADKPEIAVVVFLEKGNGPTDAAGIARTIFGAYASLRGNDGSHGTGR